MAAGQDNAAADPSGERLRETLKVALVFAIAVLLRLYHLGTFPYWQDEVHNLLQGEHLGEVLTTGNYVSNHPPGTAVLVRLWMELGMTSTEWRTRLLPVLLGLSGIFAAWLLARRLFGPRVAFYTAFLMTISPYHVHHSQEMKEYILLPFVGTLMVYAFFEAIERNTKRGWAAYAVLAALSCYSELFAGPMLVGLNLWFLLQVRGRTDRIKPWLLANIAGALLFVPQLPILWAASKATIIDLTDWWLPAPTLLSVAYHLKTLACGYSDSRPLFKVALIAYTAAAALGALYSGKKDLRRCGLLLAWFVVPTAIVFGISHVTESIFLYRSMIPYSIAFYMLVALGIEALPGVWCSRIALAAAAAIVATPLAQQYEGKYGLLEFPHRPGVHPPQRFDEAAQYILGHWEEDDIVIHPAFDPSYLPLYEYGLRAKPGRQFRGDVSEFFIDLFYKGNPITIRAKDFDAYWVKQLQPLVQGKRRFWFVFNEWERAHMSGFSYNTWRWVDAHFSQVQHQDYGGFELFLYAAREEAPLLGRDKDDGVSCTLTYGGKYAQTYAWVQPDNHLVRAPLEARRNRLCLSFAPGEQPGEISFSIENRSQEECSGWFLATANAGVLDMAALYEEQPESPIWSAQDLQVPLFQEGTGGLPTMKARIEKGSDSAAVAGSFSLPAAAYPVSLVNPIGSPVHPRLQFFWNGAPWRTIEAQASFGAVLDLGILTALPQPGIFRAVADSNGATLPSEATLGWLVAGQEARSIAPTPWKAEPGAVFRQTVPLDSTARRVDVWVFLDGPSRDAYRIFKTLEQP